MSESPDLLVPESWPRLIESLDPARMLVVIEDRMGAKLRERCEPDDILQEALLQAWLSRGSFEWRGAKSFRSWLLTIIDHRIGDEHDRIGRLKRDAHREVPLSGLAGTDSSASVMDFAGGSTTPSRVASYRERAALLRAARESLPDELREVVRLRWFEELELEEIAQRLKIGVSAIRHRARKGEVLFRTRLRALGDSRPTTEIQNSAAPARTDTSARAAVHDDR